MSVTKEQVLSALRNVQDPDLHKDIVTLGFVKEVTVEGGEVDFTVELTTPACPVKDQMKAEAEALVAALPGVTAARAKMTANVSTRGGFGRQQIPGIRNIVAVGAGKGGVGKSTTSVNLAVALAMKGARVGLLDGDVYGPNIPQMLGCTATPAVDAEKRIVPPEAHGIKVISMGMLVPADQPIIWRGPMLHGAVQQFMRDVAWGELDYLIVDLPPGTGDVALSMAQSVPMAGAVVVTTPQGVSVSDVTKAVGMFRQLNIPVLGVIENMSYFVCGHCQERTEIFGNGGGRKMAEDDADPVPRRGADRHAGALRRRRGPADRGRRPRRAGRAGVRLRREPRRGAGLHPEPAGPARHPDRVAVLSSRGAPVEPGDERSAIVSADRVPASRLPRISGRSGPRASIPVWKRCTGPTPWLSNSRDGCATASAPVFGRSCSSVPAPGVKAERTPTTMSSSSSIAAARTYGKPFSP